MRLLLAIGIMVALFGPRQTEARTFAEFSGNGNIMSMGSYTQYSTSLFYNRSGLFMSLRDTGKFFIGGGLVWQSQQIRDATTTTTMNLVDYFFGFRYILTKTEWLWIGGTISPNMTAKFKTGATAEESWTGISYTGTVMITYPSRSAFRMGFALDYYVAQYTKMTQGTTSANINQVRTDVIPVLAFGFVF